MQVAIQQSQMLRALETKAGLFTVVPRIGEPVAAALRDFQVVIKVRSLSGPSRFLVHPCSSLPFGG
jgi:hypothetical protein